MKACTLSPEGRGLQTNRFDAVRVDVVGIERTPTALTVRFAPSVDERVLDELIATERECCSFLDVSYGERVLRIGSDDSRDLDPFEAMLR